MVEMSAPAQGSPTSGLTHATYFSVEIACQQTLKTASDAKTKPIRRLFAQADLTFARVNQCRSTNNVRPSVPLKRMG